MALELVGKYEIRGRLGAGAMGTVLDAWDPVIERRAALKIVKKPATGDAEGADAMARFKREAQAAGRLTHPNIVAVYDYGEDGENAWIAMELVEGGTLKDILDRGERFPLSETRRVMGQMLAGLDYSHKRGVVHRDIKPANVMLAADGTVKIADFGIARLENSSMTQVGTVMGTPSYMAPEQLRGEPVDARADIWASGVMLYQLLTGEKPFEGGFSSVMHKAIHTEPTPPSSLAVTAPRGFDMVVAKALAKRPEDRWPTAAAFSEAIAEAMAGGGAGAPPADADATLVAAGGRPAGAAAATPTPTAAVTTPKRPPLLLIGGGVAALSAAAVVGFLMLGGGPEAPPTPGPIRPSLVTPAPAPPQDQAQVTPPAETPAPVAPPPTTAAPPTATAPGPLAPAPAIPGSPATPVTPAPPAALQPVPIPAPPTTPPPATSKPIQLSPVTPPPTPQAPAPQPQAPQPQASQPQASQPAASLPAAPPAAAPQPNAPAATPAPPGQVALVAPRLPDFRAAAAAAAAAPACGLVAASATDTSLTLQGVVRRGDEAAIRRALTTRDVPLAATRLQVQPFDGPYCPAFDVLRPVLATPDAAPQVNVVGNMPLLKGQLLRFDVTMPNWPAQLYVAYFMSSGEVAHLSPSAPQAANATVRLGEPSGSFPGWEVDEPYGTDLMVAVASERPLFDAPRPVVESQADYLAALSAALDSARQAGRRIAVRPLVIVTAPR